jgi:phospholipase C
MPPGLDQLKHIVVLMMENRSFDHLLGSLRSQDAKIDGITGHESNQDTTGVQVSVSPTAQDQGQLEPDPGHHFEDTYLQLYGKWPEGNPISLPDNPPMNGFIRSYFSKRQDVSHSRLIMNYFTAANAPVINTLAQGYAVFNRWFASLPGPTVPNRIFAHFGTSFGHLDNSPLDYTLAKYPTIYQRLVASGRTAKIYYYDEASGTIAIPFLLKQQPQLFALFDQFEADCKSGNLPDYSFVEPNYTDHWVGNGYMAAMDQHPDHNVKAGEEFIAKVYMSIFVDHPDTELWKSTLLLVVYDEHGGTYDHVKPPACTADEFQDSTYGFKFDRLGIRVPAVAISPWIPAGTVIGGDNNPPATFNHSSIPATVTKQFLPGFDGPRSPRETSAPTFLDVLLTLDQPREDFFTFQVPGLFTPHKRSGEPRANIKMINPPPASATEDRRPTSELLRDHVLALHDLLSPEEQNKYDIRKLRTEGQASAFIEQANKILRQGAAPPPEGGPTR